MSRGTSIDRQGMYLKSSSRLPDEFVVSTRRYLHKTQEETALNPRHKLSLSLDKKLRPMIPVVSFSWMMEDVPCNNEVGTSMADKLITYHNQVPNLSLLIKRFSRGFRAGGGLELSRRILRGQLATIAQGDILNCTE